MAVAASASSRSPGRSAVTERSRHRSSDQKRHRYENDPPRTVFANEPFCTAATTHAPSASSGVCFTVTLVTVPPGDTLTETLTMPVAGDLLPHAAVLIVARPALIAGLSRSSASFVAEVVVDVVDVVVVVIAAGRNASQHFSL